MFKACYSKMVSLLILGILSIPLGSFKMVSEDGKKDKPNFVFIAIDDLNRYTSHLGGLPGNFLEKIYPEEALRSDVIGRLTPNLQKLSKESVSFNQAYSAAPLCGPSRTALLTGIPPHKSNYYAHGEHFRFNEELENVVTLPQYLKENGYFTTGIGKVFHKGKTEVKNGKTHDWPDADYSWSSWVETHTGTTPSGELSRGKISREEDLSKYWDSGKNMKYTRFGTNEVPREYSNDFNNAQHAYNLLTTGTSSKRDINRETQTVKLPKNQPYFIACGLFAPHLPWVVPQEYMDRFPQEEMNITPQLLEEIKEDLEDLSKFGKGYTRYTDFDKLLEFGESVDGEGGDMNAWKAYFQAYLATVSYTDENVGYLLEAIEKSDRKDNTVLVLWSDHGYHIGDKNRTGKITLWEAANQCNFFIKDYRKTSLVRQEYTPVSLQDIYPTMISIAGLKRPDHVYGYDLSDLLNAQELNRGAVLNTHQKDNHAIRTDQYRYIRFKDGSKELYDLENDPFEEKNIANVDDNIDLIERMDELLNNTLNMHPKDY